MAKALRNPGSMRYTRYMDQCCEQLTSAAEHPTDIWIKPFVQLQVLTCRVDETFCYYDIGSSQIVGGTSVQVASRGFLLELDSIRQLLPDNLPSPSKSSRLQLLSQINSPIMQLFLFWKPTFSRLGSTNPPFTTTFGMRRQRHSTFHLCRDSAHPGPQE